MSSLILCNTVKASNPYNFRLTDTNIYTIEELCYYIYNNIYIITEEIFDEEWGIRQSFTLLCECGGEIAVLSDITSIRERAEEIFRLFVKNTVTPTSAFYVIEEMI